VKAYVSELSDGDVVESLFAVKYKKPPKAYKGKAGSWFELRLADKTGEITAKYWGGPDEEKTQEVYAGFATGDVVRLKGQVTKFNESLEVAIDGQTGAVARALEGSYELEDFLPRTEKDVSGMWLALTQKAAAVGNEHLNALLAEFLGDKAFADSFKKCPGSMSRHQNWVGGLLEHTLNVAAVCERVAELHPSVDKDLLAAGAILHDVGKISEYEVTTSIDVSRQGMLRGHVVIGEEMVRQRIRKHPNFPEILALKLSHMILAHHGRLEYGSPKTPQLAEAHALYYADELDAKVDYLVRIKKEAATEDPWVYTRDFGHVYLE